MQLPVELERNVTHALGAAGREWLDALPLLLDACARDYSLTIGPPFELSFNYVAPVIRADGTQAVLKLSPHGDDFRYEVRATRAFDGRGTARLLEADEGRGVALLERLRPGQMLVELEDDQRQTEIAAGIMLELRREPPPDVELPTTRDWCAAFPRHRAEHGGAGPLPSGLFDRAERTFEELLASSAPPVLLHGDLHHYNILSAERAPWLAIDPHGVIGEPAFEVGAYFGNPAGLATSPHVKRTLALRADIFAERLGLDRERIIAWGMAYQMLSAVWSAERDGTGWRPAVAIATMLAEMH